MIVKIYGNRNIRKHSKPVVTIDTNKVNCSEGKDFNSKRELDYTRRSRTEIARIKINNKVSCAR